MEAKTPRVVSHISKIVEGIIAVVLIIVIVYLFVRMVWDYGGLAVQGKDFAFNLFLARAIDLIIGIEFAKMLYRHTPDTVIDVLMFATARQAVLDHTRIMENLLAVIAIAILFLLRMYVVPGGENKTEATLNFFRKLKGMRDHAPEGAAAQAGQAAATEDTDARRYHAQGDGHRL